MKLTASELVKAIDQLPRQVPYPYISGRNQVELIDVVLPEGPIIARRGSDTVTVTTNFIWRVANALSDGNLVNLDETLTAGGNTRTVLETFLLHTANCFFCYPKRFESQGGSFKIRTGTKYIFWDSENTHSLGQIEKVETEKVVSTLEAKTVVYDSIELLSSDVDDEGNDLRLHTQKQIALIKAAHGFGLRAALPANDGSNLYGGQRIDAMEGVVRDLAKHPAFESPQFTEAVKVAGRIDCIWLNHNQVPAFFEVEHSTSVYSGLTRMLDFKNKYLNIQSYFVIVADDELRDKVMAAASQTQYDELRAYYMPYSSLDELFYMASNRKLRGIKREFLENFIEPCFI